MMTEPELQAVAAKLYATVFPTVGEAVYAIPECQAHARTHCLVELTGAEADKVGDMIEELVAAVAEAQVRAGLTTWITAEQTEKVRAYLEDDRLAHAASGNWHLDDGKLTRALELAGVGVRTANDARITALFVKTAALGLAAALDNADDILECNCGGKCSGTCTKAWLAQAGAEAVAVLRALAVTNNPEFAADGNDKGAASEQPAA